MDNRLSRRQWLRELVIGSAAAGMLTSCTKKPDPRDASLVVSAMPLMRPMLQIICHGMLFFQLDSVNKQLLIHVPKVDAGDDASYPHEYWAGAFQSQFTSPYIQLFPGETYTMSGVTAAGVVPKALKTTNNVVLDPANGCNCAFPPARAPWQYRRCLFSLPMPDDYQGYRPANYTGNGTAPALFASGNTVKNCKPYLSPVPLAQLTSIPLVHVFRYYTWQAGGTKIANSRGTSIYSDSQGSKCFIYAEPAADGSMAAHDHLPFFDRFFPTPLDLKFSPSIGSYQSDTASADQSILDVDLYSLSDVRYGALKGGDPTTCMSGFGGY
jgi:hypothetical protein